MIPETREIRAKALRVYESAHRLWMDTPLFAPEHPEVLAKLNQARSAYQAAVELDMDEFYGKLTGQDRIAYAAGLKVLKRLNFREPWAEQSPGPGEPA